MSSNSSRLYVQRQEMTKILHFPGETIKFPNLLTPRKLNKIEIYFIDYNAIFKKYAVLIVFQNQTRYKPLTFIIMLILVVFSAKTASSSCDLFSTEKLKNTSFMFFKW